MTHLRKKSGETGGYFEEPAVELEIPLEPVVACDLSVPEWSVVSFDRVEGHGMSYTDASRLLSELEDRGVCGLCLITDAAAARITRS